MMEQIIKNHQGFIQHNLKSLSNLPQKIHQLNKVYNWHLKLHIKEAWLADKKEDAELLSKIKHNNEMIILLKVKFNVDCQTVNREYLKKKKTPSVSQVAKEIFTKDGPISGFSYISVLAEGFSYAHIILALHVKTFPKLMPAVQFIKQSQKKLAQFVELRNSQNVSKERKINFNLVHIPEYAFIIDSIAQHEQELKELIEKKKNIEKAYANDTKVETPWPMSGTSLNELLNLKNRIPLKNCKYQLY